VAGLQGVQLACHKIQQLEVSRMNDLSLKAGDLGLGVQLARTYITTMTIRLSLHVHGANMTVLAVASLTMLAHGLVPTVRATSHLQASEVCPHSPAHSDTRLCERVTTLTVTGVH